MTPSEVSASSLASLIIPLVTSTATLTLSIFQIGAVRAFLGDPTTAGLPLSKWWNGFFRYSIIPYIALPATSAICGWTTWRDLNGSNGAQWWYGWAGTFAAAHFAFVPLVAIPINKVKALGNQTQVGSRSAGEERERQEEEEDRREGSSGQPALATHNKWRMQKSLKWHTLRSIVIDCPAMVFFAAGLYHYMRGLAKLQLEGV